MKTIANYIINTFLFKEEFENSHGLVQDKSEEYKLVSDKLIIRIRKTDIFSFPYCNYKISLHKNFQHNRFISSNINLLEFYIPFDLEITERYDIINTELSKIPLLKQRLRDHKLNFLID